MLPEIEMNRQFLEKCLIQVLSDGSKTFGELGELTNFYGRSTYNGLLMLKDDGIVEEGDIIISGFQKLH